jgi:hypothetical protein
MAVSNQHGARADPSEVEGPVVEGPHAPGLAGTGTVELALRMPDGRTWSLTFSRGIERFIGCYPRLAGVDPGGSCLTFRTH